MTPPLDVAAVRADIARASGPVMPVHVDALSALLDALEAAQAEVERLRAELRTAATWWRTPSGVLHDGGHDEVYRHPGAEECRAVRVIESEENG